MSEHGPQAWLLRHGETDWSALGRHTGRTDIPLTERGRREAGLLEERLRTRVFVGVFTSPLHWRRCLARSAPRSTRSSDSLRTNRSSRSVTAR